MSGRPPKVGIDFAGWSVDIFENDTKIDALIDAQGWTGFSIYFFLCQKAYASDGYFYRWSYANASTTARKMGGGIGSGTVKEAVGACLRIGLFDKGLFDTAGVLTSRGIQRRYAEAIQKRRHRKVEARYWLLGRQETADLHIVLIDDDPAPANTRLPEANPHLKDANGDLQTQGGIKERKVKDSRVKEREGGEERRPAPAAGGSVPPPPMFPRPTVEQVRAYCEENGLSVNAAAFTSYYDANGWVQGNGKPILDWRPQASLWALREAEKEAREAKRRKEPDARSFHNFKGREYDFGELERRLLG